MKSSMLDGGGYFSSIAACWIMWIPLQGLNFSVVPPPMRVAVSEYMIVLTSLMKCITVNSVEL